MSEENFLEWFEIVVLPKIISKEWDTFEIMHEMRVALARIQTLSLHERNYCGDNVT